MREAKIELRVNPGVNCWCVCIAQISIEWHEHGTGFRAETYFTPSETRGWRGRRGGEQ